MTSTSTSSPDTRFTIAHTIVRVALGVVFFAHGWQKIFEFTIPGTQAFFAQVGVPAAQLLGPAVGFLELLGGVALILGLLVRPVAALLAVDMIVALFLVHAPAGLFVDQGGYEFVFLLAVGAIAMAVAGAGRFSLDARLFGGRQNRVAAVLA